jgi:hypothetical protein
MRPPKQTQLLLLQWGWGVCGGTVPSSPIFHQGGDGSQGSSFPRSWRMPGTWTPLLPALPISPGGRIHLSRFMGEKTENWRRSQSVARCPWLRLHPFPAGLGACVTFPAGTGVEDWPVQARLALPHSPARPWEGGQLQLPANGLASPGGAGMAGGSAPQPGPPPHTQRALSWPDQDCGGVGCV